jgi:hypothetical protein
MAETRAAEAKPVRACMISNMCVIEASGGGGGAAGGGVQAVTCVHLVTCVAPSAHTHACPMDVSHFQPRKKTL